MTAVFQNVALEIFVFPMQFEKVECIDLTIYNANMFFQ